MRQPIDMMTYKTKNKPSNKEQKQQSTDHKKKQAIAQSTMQCSRRATTRSMSKKGSDSVQDRKQR
jgi:hypothetical protein